MCLMPGNQRLFPQLFSILEWGYIEESLEEGATNRQVRMLSVFHRGKVVISPKSGGLRECQVCIEWSVLLEASAVQREEFLA